MILKKGLQLQSIRGQGLLIRRQNILLEPLQNDGSRIKSRWSISISLEIIIQLCTWPIMSDARVKDMRHQSRLIARTVRIHQRIIRQLGRHILQPQSISLRPFPYPMRYRG